MSFSQKYRGKIFSPPAMDAHCALFLPFTRLNSPSESDEVRCLSYFKAEERVTSDSSNFMEARFVV